MLIIDTATLSNKKLCNDFAKALLIKSGIIRNLFYIIDYVECEISYQYENLNDEDTDRISNNYGGLIYTGFDLVSNGQVSHFFRRLFNDDEKTFLIKLSNSDSIYMSVVRTENYKHTWSFVFELSEDNSEVFTLDVEVEINTINKSIDLIQADFSIESLAINHCEHKRLVNAI